MLFVLKCITVSFLVTRLYWDASKTIQLVVNTISTTFLEGSPSRTSLFQQAFFSFLEEFNLGELRVSYIKYELCPYTGSAFDPALTVTVNFIFTLRELYVYKPRGFLFGLPHHFRLFSCNCLVLLLSVFCGK